MTAHPIDTEALRRLADAATEGPWEHEPEFVNEDGTLYMPPRAYVETWIGYPVNDEGEAILPCTDADAEFIAAAREAVPALLDALAAAEHRATRAETQSETRRINTLYWQERAGAAQSSARTLAKEFEETQDRAHEAEARIKAVRDIVDEPADDTTGMDANSARYTSGYELALQRVGRVLEG